MAAELSAFVRQKPITVVITATLGLYSVARLIKWTNKGDETLPPLVKYNIPAIGSTLELIRDPEGFLTKCAKIYGPIFRVYALGNVQTFVSKEFVREIILDEAFSFTAAIDDIINWNSLSFGQASKLGPIFHNIVLGSLTPRQLKQYIPQIVPHLTEQRDLLLDSGEGAIKIKLHVVLEHMIGKAIGRIFVGPDLCQNEELLSTFRDIAKDIGGAVRMVAPFMLLPKSVSFSLQKLLFGLTNPMEKHKKTASKILIPEIIRRQKEMAEQPDRFDRPYDMMQDMMEMTPVQSTDDIVENLLQTAFASIDTTVGHLGLVLAAIANYPQYVPELLQEQKEVLSAVPSNEYNTPYTAESLRKMVKLGSFIREVIRLKHINLLIFPLKNVSGCDIILSNGMKVPAGTQVNFNWVDIHSTDSIPEFNPWRWVEDKDIAQTGPDFLLFGLGKHACPGRWLASAVMKLVTALIITKYTISLPDPSIDVRTMNHSLELIFQRRT